MAALQKSENTTKALNSGVDKLQKEIKVLQTPDAAKLLRIVGKLPPSTIPSGMISYIPALRSFAQIWQPDEAQNVETTSTVKFTLEAKQWEINMTAETTEASTNLRKLYRTGCTWLDIVSTDREPKFQHGTYTALEHRIVGILPLENSRLVTFAQPYAAPPQCQWAHRV